MKTLGLDLPTMFALFMFTVAFISIVWLSIHRFKHWLDDADMQRRNSRYFE